MTMNCSRQVRILSVAVLFAAALASPLVTMAQTWTAHTEYIHAGSQVVASVFTPATYFTDSAFGTSPYLPFLGAADLMYTYQITVGCGASHYFSVPTAFLTGRRWRYLWFGRGRSECSAIRRRFLISRSRSKR